jgi:hypothetical protein
MIDCSFVNNYAYGFAGAIQAETYSRVEIFGGLLFNNYAYSGGAIFVYYLSKLFIDRYTVIN